MQEVSMLTHTQNGKKKTPIGTNDTENVSPYMIISHFVMIILYETVLCSKHYNTNVGKVLLY